MNARAYSRPAVPGLHVHSVDCYAVQHPGGAERDRRQRQSIAVHLISLCLLLEFDQRPTTAPQRRRRTSRVVLGHLGLPDWPYLPAPARRGAVTAADVNAGGTLQQHADDLHEWAQAAWGAWAAHHETIRRWAAIAVRRQP